MTTASLLGQLHILNSLESTTRHQSQVSLTLTTQLYRSQPRTAECPTSMAQLPLLHKSSRERSNVILTHSGEMSNYVHSHILHH